VYLNISSLFFHINPKIVQALFVAQDEIFHALAVERDVLLPKPFLDLGFDGVQPRLSPLGISRVWQTEKFLRGWQFSSEDTIKAGIQKYVGSKTCPPTARAWKISS
jgi:hypothetical protein